MKNNKQYEFIIYFIIVVILNNNVTLFCIVKKDLGYIQNQILNK
jgi:hypothetical protein